MISNTDLLSYVASGKIVRPAYLDKAEYIFKIGLEMFEHIRARPANRYYDDIMIGDNFVTCQDDFTIGSIKKCYLADAWRIDRYIRDAIFALQTISFNSKRDPEHPEVANMSCFELLNGQGINDNSTYNTFFTEFLGGEEHTVFCKSLQDNFHENFIASSYYNFTDNTFAPIAEDPSSFDLCIGEAPIFFRPQDIYKAVAGSRCTIELEREIGRSCGVFYTSYHNGFAYMLGTFEDVRKIVFRKWEDYSAVHLRFDVESDNDRIENDYPSFT